MSATPPDWRVRVRKGDKLSITASYETQHASWYEGMGIMVAWMTDDASGKDPFTTDVNVPGILTHGHLPENDNHGGPAPDTKHYVDLTKLPSKTVPDRYVIDISNFAYAAGDMSIATSVPTIKQGQSITFNNLDAPLNNGIWHTITDCEGPCDGSTGIAYPLANGKIIFDSGQLGNGGTPRPPRGTCVPPRQRDPGPST